MPTQRPSTSPAAKTAAIVAADPTAVVKPEGDWTYTVESPQGGGGILKIKKEGEVLSGSIINSRSNRETALKAISLVGNELTFSYEVNFGGNTNSMSFKGIITGDVLTGTMSMGQFGAFPMTGKRAQ